MKALILNSGLGSRMGALTKEHPKCMTEIAPGETIVSRQLRLLSDAGIRDVVMTTGVFAEVLRNYCESLGLPIRITYVLNPRCRETNYIYSIYCAREELEDDILLMHGDLVFGRDVLDGMLARAMHATSELGAKLDSAADLLFYAVMLIRIFPVLWQKLPRSIWLIVGAAVFIRLISYSYVAIRYHRFSSMHTAGNKLTGLMVFLTPYFISLPEAFATPCCFAVAIVAFLSSAQELMMHLRKQTYAS